MVLRRGLDSNASITSRACRPVVTVNTTGLRTR